MALDLVSDVFKPVADRVESRLDSLRDFLKKRHRHRPTVPRNAGVERYWFKDEVREALGDLVVRFCHKGPDLVLRDGYSTMMIELRAATNLNTSDKNGSPREGVMKYCDMPDLAGCIFLGDGSKDSQIKKLSDGNVKLRERRMIRDGERTWIVGLLTSSTS